MFAAILMLGGAWVVISNLGDILAGLLGFKGLDAFLGYWGAMVVILIFLETFF